ncbi:MAG TPA: glycosyl hydrolase family 65 protein, partial [Acidimicrobiales bacterium]|nr:glycosyl hydrolase family 65 protein [Acidimicrobiales bacterium]
YRFHRLPKAIELAREAGHQGAMFPWQSGSDGRDETPTQLFNPRSGKWIPDRSRYQRHVGLAITYNFWKHFQATGDTDHLAREGAAVMIEVARFFSSLATFDEDLGRNRIRGVMGPDEFHDGYPWSDDPGIDDNAYTNVMAAWLFARVAELVELLEESGRSQMLESLAVTTEELDRFDDLTRTLHVPVLDDGVVAQFEGYDKLDPIDLGAYSKKYGNIGRLDLILDGEGDSVRRYQVAKQADVLMLLYLFSAEELRMILERLGLDFQADAIRRTVAFYSHRVVHGSSLSRVVHAWVNARENRRESWRLYRKALSIDVQDSQGGTTREGIHLGAMGGTADILTRCYTGLEVRADALWLNPRLPRELEQLAFPLEYRGHILHLEIDHKYVVVDARDGPSTPSTILVQSHPYTLGPGGYFRHELL